MGLTQTAGPRTVGSDAELVVRNVSVPVLLVHAKGRSGNAGGRRKGK